MACDSDGTRPTVPTEIRGILVSPGGDVGAAVLDLSGVDHITAVGGQAFTAHVGQVLRAVIILDTPGQIEFRVMTSDVTGDLSATVVEVSDANDEIPPSLSGYRVRFVL
jgi:hypothetical protein